MASKKVKLSEGLGFAKGDGVSDFALRILRIHDAMGNMQGLRNALEHLEHQIDTEYRQKVIDEIRAMKDRLVKGMALEAEHGEGYMLDLSHPMIERWKQAGYYLSDERIAAAGKRPVAGRKKAA